jgi:hypothetical protein
MNDSVDGLDRAVLLERLGSGSASDMTEGTLIVVPSITFPPEELAKITGIQFYEERLLFLLLLLKAPELRVLFVTSLRVEEPIVDYYLSFIDEDLRPGERLYLIALWDPAPDALSVKLLRSEWALDRMAELADDPVLLTFNVTEHEREIATRIGAPLYGCPPELVSLGSKSGSRTVAREAGVEVLPGAEDLYSEAAINEAIGRLHGDHGDSGACVVKLNNGFSGQGNLIVELDGFESLRGSEHRFCAEDEDWDGYLAKVERDGAIVELLLRGESIVSPSVQMRIGATGDFEVVSTHDQILGGPDGHVYLGCRFPARDTYRQAIQEAGRKVASVLAQRGVVGSFGADLLIDLERDPSTVYLSEINLRLGGTTHPFLMAEYVTGGHYDETTGHLLVDDRPRFYAATDNLKDERLVGTPPQDLIQAVAGAGLAYDKATATGVTLHLLGALKKFGKVGAVCIGETPDQADEMHDHLLKLIDRIVRD